ncbi:putative ferric reductase [Algoriphagus sp. 4150]|uniref:ferredoxin reductase family protein n=1 Tax=Algoriphagus sp. 4150 TaxID=2817756 RepID=UPI002856B10B|nr:ferric reductase-like transmembrane domain-containing protein [Algoriphagus sp. 4150]MDR7130037.1 putative ferric reductase [Algoriphagus sp. 4150]
MGYTYRHGFLWLFIYFVLALIPLLLAISGELPIVREFWIELGVAFGFIGLGMMGMQFLFTGRFQKIAPTYNGDNMMQFHKQIGIISILFVLAHPITLILTDASFLAYFDPHVNFMRALALSFVLVCLVGIIGSSLWRKALKLNYEKWRLLHGLLALAIVFIGVVHALQVSHYMEPLWKKLALSATMGACMYLVIHTRIVRPLKNKRHPYKIVRVTPELSDCYTLELEAMTGKKMHYLPGQYCWITINTTPFSLQQHPFSLCSSARQPNIQLTAKALGDFTDTWKTLPLGTTAFLEGPFGVFIPEPGAHLFLIMGGIGITPAMSMLRTMRDDNDPRQATLIYANQDWENITFREELEALTKEINLNLVHVLEEADDDWKGEKGLVTEELLKRHFPRQKEKYMYFICGPGPLMDTAEVSLRNLGIEWRLVYSERFEMV